MGSTRDEATLAPGSQPRQSPLGTRTAAQTTQPPPRLVPIPQQDGLPVVQDGVGKVNLSEVALILQSEFGMNQAAAVVRQAFPHYVGKDFVAIFNSWIAYVDDRRNKVKNPAGFLRRKLLSGEIPDSLTNPP